MAFLAIILSAIYLALLPGKPARGRLSKGIIVHHRRSDPLRLEKCRFPRGRLPLR